MKRISPAFRWFLLGAVGLGTAMAFWDKAFPTASLDFPMSRSQIEARMRQWIETQGHPLSAYRHAARFGEATETKNYLELETGLPALNRLTRQGVSIWYWYGRWFKPEQEEEFSVSLDTHGNLVGYDHTIEEARAAPLLEKEAARALAEKFLQTHVPQHPSEQLRFVEESAEKKPHRTDYTFTWERNDLKVKDAPYRLEVTVQGDRIGAYTEWLKIPEAWTREFDRKQELNQLCATLAGYASYPLYAGGVILFILYIYQRKLDWKQAFPWGWIVLFGVVSLADDFNNIPSTVMGYFTTQNWGSFVMEEVSAALQKVLLTVAGIWLLILVVDPLYREGLPRHLPFRIALGAGALRHREVLRSIGLGTAFALASLGYVCLFYVVGRPFGVWSPVDVDYSKALSGWLPWIEPLEVGLSASFIEEMTFRVLAILLYQKIFRSRWAAIILAAMTWAFLHSNYPQMPGYIRGIELTVEGILWGWLMVRFGLLTPLVAHYLYDCWLGSFIVAQSPNWSDRAGAVLVSTGPILLGIWGWWNYARKNLLIETLSATAVPPPASSRASQPRWWEIPASRWTTAIQSLSTSQRWRIILLSLAILAIDFMPLPQDRMRQLGAITQSRAAISEAADTQLAQHRQNPEHFHKIVSLTGGSTETKYLLEHGDLDSVAGLFNKEWPDLQWQIRYFRFGEREEFIFYLDKNGHFLSWDHIIPRECPGTSLEKEAALSLAQRHLGEQYKINLSDEKLIQDNLTQQEKRRDYSFTFQRCNWHWGEAELRTSIRVQGDETMDCRRFIKTPDAWSRAEAASGWKDSLVHQLATWLGVGKAALFVLLFVIMIRKNILPWRSGFLLALAPTALGLLNWFNGLPWFFSDYDTVTPVFYHTFSKLGGLLFGTVAGYLGQVLEASITLGLMRWAFDWKLSELSIRHESRQARDRFWLDAWALGLLGVAIWNGKAWLNAWTWGWLFPYRVAFFSFPQIHAVLPWFSELSTALLQGYHGVFHVAFKVSVAVILYRRFPKTVWGFLILTPVFAAMSEKTWGEFFCIAASGELNFLINLILIWRIWRFHAWALFFAYALYSILPSIELFVRKGGFAYQWEAVPLGIVFLLPILIGLLRRKKAPAQPT